MLDECNLTGRAPLLKLPLLEWGLLVWFEKISKLNPCGIAFHVVPEVMYDYDSPAQPQRAQVRRGPAPVTALVQGQADGFRQQENEGKGMEALQQVSDLIKQIRLGELILPEFQRGYVWERPKVKAYVQSLYLRYPTGHFLIWKTYSQQRTRGEGPSTDNSFSRLILDGQQRLTSLFTLFEGKPPAFYEGEELYFDLFFNIRDEEFQFYQKSKMDADPCWVAITPLLLKGLHPFIAELETLPQELSALYLKHLSRFTKLDAIRSYPYNLDEVSDKPIEVIVKIFNLVNSSGTELSNADLALATMCIQWPEARQTLRDSREQFKSAGFDFKLEFLTRCISAVAVGNVYFEGGFNKASQAQLKSAWTATERVLLYLVNILRNDAYIDSSESLTSVYVLIPMLVHLTRCGEVFKDEVEKRAFLYWMYQALMWARYSGSTDTNLQADVNVLSEKDPVTGLIDNILQERGRVKVESKDLEGQGTRSSFYTLASIVARSRGALDWFTGMTLYNSNLGKSFGLEDHHIFPQSVLYKNGFDKGDPKQRKIVNEIANRAFLTKRANLRASNALPVNYLKVVQSKFKHALDAQFVPKDPSLWEVENYLEFLAERRKQMADAINSFLEALLTSLEQPKPADEQILDVVAAGESATVEFKSSMRWDYVKQGKNKDLERVIAKSVVGFLNSKVGGTLLIGISPTDEILGIENDYATFSKDQNRDGYEQKLIHLLGNYIGKEFCSLVHISFIAVNGKDVCRLRVDPAPKPAYLDDGNEVRFFVRLGNTTQPMNVKETTEYLAMRWDEGSAMSAAPSR